MDADFWLRRWRENQIGFHQTHTTPALERYWNTLGLPRGSRVFVPLAGKSLDLLWLAAQGHRVLGVELSALAVEQFFAENALTPTVHESRYGRHHVAGAVELIQGDAFALDEAALADCTGVYDRAALIALPPATRARYVGELYARPPAGCRGLLVTLEYPQPQKKGPPFSVEEDEVRALYEPGWDVERLERRDVLAEEPRFVAEGLTTLSSAVYRLRHRRDQAGWAR